jgi:hypothetical protein
LSKNFPGSNALRVRSLLTAHRLRLTVHPRGILLPTDTNAQDFIPNPGFVKSSPIFLAENELSERRKGDKEKVKLARRLRSETTMTLGWIAGQLRMGSWTYVSNLLREKP